MWFEWLATEAADVATPSEQPVEIADERIVESSVVHRLSSLVGLL